MSSRILIVEDDAIVAAHLERAIVRMGYQVAGLVATGEDAIAQAEALHPDVIVMDIRLRSEMNGVEAAVQIRARADIPIIYLSAYADENFVNAATATQAYGYLTKPVRDKELNASIEVALYKSRTDRALAHLNEVLRAIRSVNQLIVHERDSGRLLDHACQLLVTIRGYHHASIVAPRKRPSELFLLHFAAAEGVNASPFEAILGQPIDDSLPCLLAAALRKAIVSEDLIGDAAPPRWRERAKALGIGAQMSAPMWLGAQLYGVLSVYSAFPRAFDPDEVAVLSELASDLAVALRNHAADAERQRGEQALRTSQQAYRELVENLNDVVFSLDALGLVTYLSPAIRDVSGYAPDELVGRPFLDVVQADDHAKCSGRSTRGRDLVGLLSSVL
jgi:two-component system cell cycle sensor histidine kinase/response regulator CckA